MSCFPSTIKGGEAWLGQFPGANVVQLKAVVQVFYGDFNRFDLNPLQFKWLIIYPDLTLPQKFRAARHFNRSIR